MAKSRRRLHKFFSNFVTILVFLTAVGGFAALLLQQQKTFPNLPAGAYNGVISGISENEGKTSTIYAERIRNTNALLFVIFHEGWKPQVVPAVAKAKKRFFGLLGTELALEPVIIKEGNRVLALTGAARVSSYSGQTTCGDRKCGTWTLAPVSVSELRQRPPVPSDAFDLREWLRLKAEDHSLGLEYDFLEKSVAEKTEQRDKIDKFLEHQDLLQIRARQRQEQITKDLQDLTAKDEAKNNEVKQLVRELEQLSRITRRGQAIELARRVGKREAKWYFVNWQQGADLSAMEESLAERMGVDLLKLRNNVKRAQEIDSLKNTIAIERARLEKLQRLYQEKIQTGTRGTPSPGRQEQPSRNWWSRWDSIFPGGSDE